MDLSNKPKLLFVDDERATRTAFTRFMTRSGFQVDAASSGPIALRMAQRSQYAVVIADLHMPGMDGLRLIDKLAEVSPSSAYVLTTGDATREVFDRVRAAPRSIDILPKPWDWEVVLEVVARATAASSNLEEASLASVLVIEDDAADRLIVTSFLDAAYGGACEVTQADRLSTALEQIASKSPDVILADLSLPDSFGLLTVDQIHRAAPESAMIVISGNDDEENATQAVRAGAQDYLVKNEIDARSIKRAIRYALERKATEQRLTRLAHYDQLTGVANRITFNDRLAQMLSRAKRKGTQLGVMYVDLDYFKEVNDTYGHRAGDELLAEAADRICAAVRDYDTVARLGGDEFAVLVDEPNLESSRIVAGRVVKSLAEAFELSTATVEISSSVGVAVFPSAADDTKSLLEAADRAMYRAKSLGRNQFCVHDDDDDTSAPRTQRIALKKAIREEQFVLHYQPQLDILNGRISGVEALLRWVQRDGVLMPPLDFVPQLEQSGLIIEAGAWVIENSCQKLSQWTSDGHALRLAINVSPRQIESAGFPQTVHDALSRNSVSPASLEIEITESILMRDTATVRRALEELKEIGVRVALDDFGTGHSSLTYLQSFDVDAIKIDRSFVSAIGARGGAIVNAIIALGTQLGIDVVAEGVENGFQLSHLIESGCSHAQGFLLGAPRGDWTHEQFHSIEADAEGGGVVAPTLAAS